MYYMFLADGFEESEALVTLDMMRRAKIPVKTVSIFDKVVKGTHSISVLSDISIDEVSDDCCDGIVLPGGMPGTENLFNNKKLTDCVDFCAKNNKLIASICAAPSIPGRMGLLKGKKAVCFPGFETKLIGANVCDDLCVRDHNFITAKGAGAVFEFSYEIIKYIINEKTASDIISEIQHSQF